jgi:hypothetical protein
MKTIVIALLCLGGATTVVAWAPPIRLASSRIAAAPPTNNTKVVRAWNSQLHVGSKDNIEQEAKDTTSDAFLSNESTKDWKQPIPYSELTIGVLKETYPGENRVSQTPDSVHNLVKAGFTVVVEAGGEPSFV